MNHTPFLIAGYGITWIAVVAYLLRIRRREREVGEQSGTVPGGTPSSE